ncbi:DUF402 domain-containing protein [Zhihengliuella flava]|uniref:DUF402 domain-containing protein n=1 Tax=Zhihengliuella flava TaxID=1285193 RepID=A0A931DBT4_9MICC|nr:DUF402 domain-containing protein [Zhihengliuella flava]MBG6085693.1 hypothetical protein [Zhihengliuella flava]
MPTPFPADVRAAPEGIHPGDLVVARAWKFDAGPHWVVPGTYLGADRTGHWIFQPGGAFVARPGAAFFAESDAVCLIPHRGAGADVETDQWVATFYDASHPGDFRVYIDVSTHIGWRPLAPHGWEVHSVDMDLDVVRSTTRGVYLDDEDEFEQHRIDYGYPAELTALLRAGAEELVAAVSEGRGVFAAVEDGTSRTALDWLNAARRAASSSAKPEDDGRRPAASAPTT